jgi:hypothetical protein
MAYFDFSVLCRQGPTEQTNKMAGRDANKHQRIAAPPPLRSASVPAPDELLNGLALDRVSVVLASGAGFLVYSGDSRTQCARTEGDDITHGEAVSEDDI